MTVHRTPTDAGIVGDGWQVGFLHALRASGNVSAAARPAGTCRQQRRPADKQHFRRKRTARQVQRDHKKKSYGGFTFRAASILNHGPVLHCVVLMNDMRPVIGGHIEVGEWRCLNFGMGPLVNAGSWIGLFVRVA